MPALPPIYLIDGSAYIYRAYHAIAPLSNKSGLPTHAVLGFTNILLRVLRDKAVEYLAVAFDAKGPTFRHAAYPRYKANRPAMPDDLIPQIPYIKELVKAYNILALEQQGVEADDLIASAAVALSRTGHPVVVVSGDKDLFQLVSDRVSLWEPMRDLHYDPAAVHEKYQVTPEQLLDFFALIGDAGDNVPGVPGVGPKTAEKLINQFGSLEALYADLARLGKKKLTEKLAANREAAFLSKKLIRLKEDVPVPLEPAAYQRQEPDIVRLKELFSELGFTRLLKSEVPAGSVGRSGFVLVQDQDSLEQMLGEFDKAPFLVVDTETSSLDPLTADLVGISLCISAGQAFYIPVGHRDETGELLPGQMKQQTVLDQLRPCLEDPELAKIGHNLKFDYSVFLTHKIRLAGPLWDTMIASYLLEPSRRTHGLDDLCREHLDLALTSFAEVTDKDKRPDSFVRVKLEAARDYSCEDVYATCRLWELFRPRLEQDGLWPLFAELEMPLVPILANMERTGIIVDSKLLADLSTEFAAQLDELEKEIHHLAGGPFNINSPRQLGEVLFDKLKLPHGRKTKTGFSTDVKVLQKLAHVEIVQQVMAYRNLAKLKSTYVDKLASLVHPVSGRLHTSFNQTVTATGRLSSSNPNLQNIPIRTAAGQRIREAFVPAVGHFFIAGDYSQIDLRVLAHYSQDPALLAAFRSGEDIHARTAAEIYMVSPLLITPEMRRVAKTINFGIVYGMSSFGLANQLDLSRSAAQTFIDRYFAHYAGVKRFMTDIVDQARRDGYVTTLLNRRRFLPDINSRNRNQREFAERTAINTPIQGTAADIIKLAMIKVDAALARAEMNARMLLQIHDELVFEAPEDEVEQTKGLVREAMESVLTLDVPLVVNMASGKNLAEV
ncbi:MAG: DNA polymerase I [Desulfobacterales bacterium]|nr:DNA polymerase I [Desulfobacterales bacterium]